MNRDFFGLKGRDINHLPFIDRLNIHSKSGYTLPVVFNKQEQDFIDRVQTCETFEDVLKLTNEIWDYSKEEQSQTNIPQDEFVLDEDGEDYETQSGSGDGDAETDGNGKDKAKAKGKGDDESDDESNESDEDDGQGKNKQGNKNAIS